MCHASGDIGNMTVGMGTFPPCQPPNCPTANRVGAVGQDFETANPFDGVVVIVPRQATGWF
jgi:hypothetical protein